MRFTGTAGRIAGGALVLALPLLGTALGAAPAAAAAQPHSPSVTTLYYNTNDAPDLVAQVNQAAANWNALVDDVKLVSGTRRQATIIIHETDNGEGSYTQTDGHGHGNVYIDEQQIAQGFDPTRIAVHELGHNLGLPDDYSGPCSEVMSGHGPGTSCTNAIPSAAEAAQVEANWAGDTAALPAARPELVLTY
jgi:snapalysin